MRMEGLHFQQVVSDNTNSQAYFFADQVTN